MQWGSRYICACYLPSSIHECTGSGIHCSKPSPSGSRRVTRAPLAHISPPLPLPLPSSRAAFSLSCGHWQPRQQLDPSPPTLPTTYPPRIPDHHSSSCLRLGSTADPALDLPCVPSFPLPRVEAGHCDQLRRRERRRRRRRRRSNPFIPNPSPLHPTTIPIATYPPTATTPANSTDSRQL